MVGVVRVGCEIYRFNRTFMELKFARNEAVEGVAVGLIVPLWN